jgi:hypothetical protein
VVGTSEGESPGKMKDKPLFLTGKMIKSKIEEFLK